MKIFKAVVEVEAEDADEVPDKLLAGDISRYHSIEETGEVEPDPDIEDDDDELDGELDNKS